MGLKVVLQRPNIICVWCLDFKNKYPIYPERREPASYDKKPTVKLEVTSIIANPAM